MAPHAMVRGAHPQTRHHAREKASKDRHIRPPHLLVPPPFKHIQRDPDEEEDEAAEKVGVDVDAFVVQVEQRLQAFGEGVGGRGPVVGEDVRVILVPCREGGVGEEEGTGGRGGGEEFAGQEVTKDRGGDGAVGRVAAPDGGGHWVGGGHIMIGDLEQTGHMRFKWW